MTKSHTVLALLMGAICLNGCAGSMVGVSGEGEALRLPLKAARDAGPVVVGRTTRDPCSVIDVNPDPGVQSQSAFALGALGARECAVRDLLGASDLSLTPSYPIVRRDVMWLYNFYNRRAERQQTFMDLGSGITIVGAAGAFEGGISASTREAWAIAAFVPIVISQFNAYEPTRELFHGGALALQLITLRYDRYNRTLALLGDPRAVQDCAPFVTARDAISAWGQAANLRGRDPDGELLAEARRLHTACVDVKSRDEALAFTRYYASQLSPYLAAEYAADVLQLDHAIVGKDRELRYSPSETLSALVASPFRAADMLLTGQNTKAALDGLKTQIAFSGLNRNLATIALPPLPSPSATVAPLSDPAAALGRRGAAVVVVEQVAALRVLATSLRDRQRQQAFELRLASDLSDAANADYLTFVYDAVTTTTTVSLGPRPQTTPLASGRTGTGSVLEQ